MAWMETDYSRDMHFQWKMKWWLEHLSALGILRATAPNDFYNYIYIYFFEIFLSKYYTVFRLSIIYINMGGGGGIPTG